MSKRRADGPPLTRRPNKPKKSRGQRVRGLLKTLTIFGVVGLLILVGVFFVLYKAIAIPEPNEAFKAQTTFVYYSGGKDDLGTYYDDQNRQSIPLSEMPQTMQDAVVAAENRTFWTDKGLDPKGILRAAFSNAKGNAQQGASTITQQYVKILYLTSERSYQRKLKEAIVSLKIRNQLGKAEILEGYLNTIYFGRGAYGIQAAAGAFFDKDAKDLDLRESAVLATTLNNPSRYDPDNGRDAKQELKERYGYILDGMADMGTISADEAEKAKKHLPKFPEIATQSQFGGQRGHMLTLVKKELLGLGFDEQEIDGGGLRVTTTFTKDAMAAAEQGVLEERPEGFGDKELHVGAATVEVGTGALRGFYGGQDYLDSQINWAATGGMAGSTIKPLTIAAAIKDGFELQDSFDGNSPYVFPDGLEVRNEGTGSDGLGNDYGSQVSLITAAEESINTAFVDMSDSMDEGPQKIYDMARALGIPGDEPSKKYSGIPSRSVDFTPEDTLITLGKGRVSPINMANAYATIANGGERADVHVVEKVVDHNGETVYSWKQSSRRAVDEDIAADTSYAMQQIVQNGTGQAALELGRPAAGKTGTATNGKDEVSSAWFAGYTPQMATAVMYLRGDGDNQLDGWLPSYFGAVYPAQTWTAIMSSIMEGLDVEDFPEPAYVDGDAPSEGHEPYVPPATTFTPQPQPTRKPTKSATIKTQEPDPTETPTPTPVPTPTPTVPAPTETVPPPTTPPPTTPAPAPTVAPSRVASRSFALR
ncbi:transglycosylase domain-containing protein [Nocardioides sp.]|uniref:transglycosylase domain-containing protein n=1 Tax=Nocardioides sp. TaxID=35761 RepID=UPI00286D7763|nr:transglycosylase domain-containing protein [Nocardioides sp.]